MMKKSIILSIVIAILFIAIVSCAIWLSMLQTPTPDEPEDIDIADKNTYIFDPCLYRSSPNNALLRIKPIELVDIIKDVKELRVFPLPNYKYPYNVIIKAELLEDYYEKLDKPLDSEILLAFALLDYSDVENDPIPPMQALADKILACDEMIVYSIYTDRDIQYESILPESTNDNNIINSKATLIPYNYGVIPINDGKVNYTDYRNVFCLYDEYLERYGERTKCVSINDGDSFKNVQQIIFKSMDNGSFGGENIKFKYAHIQETALDIRKIIQITRIQSD